MKKSMLSSFLVPALLLYQVYLPASYSKTILALIEEEDDRSKKMEQQETAVFVIGEERELIIANDPYEEHDKRNQLAHHLICQQLMGLADQPENKAESIIFGEYLAAMSGTFLFGGLEEEQGSQLVL